ncbi:MAG: hypothetical protein Sylvanvirus20_11 [Sylvanvirus sp.]|uniref:Uncharacterized protein n=1 Tax=Sylvanvirus sp. TaxID=2487774 RepID=A0A3G5AIL5_9VIRU|nr:MAG: hypothetical protein Sylvanvirus20_11 [Sylvanvirus sp.]
MSKLVYPLELEEYKIFKMRRTLFESLEDSGFRVNLQTHPNFPSSLSPVEFKQRVIQCLHEQQVNFEDGGNGTNNNHNITNASPSASSSSPISSNTSTTIITPQGVDPIRDHVKSALLKPLSHVDIAESLKKLDQTIEWSLFMYAEQDLTHISNLNDQTSPILKSLLEDTTENEIPQNVLTSLPSSLPLSASNNNSTVSVAIPPIPKNILVLFCREENILTETYQCLLVYLNYYGLSDAIIVSPLGCSSRLSEQLVRDGDGKKGPCIRVMSYKQVEDNNAIRTSKDTPLYRRLNSFEVKALERRYGSIDKFPGMFKSRPVCQYYGFRVGDVILVNTCRKRFGEGKNKFKHVQDHLESPSSYIQNLIWSIVLPQ